MVKKQVTNERILELIVTLLVAIAMVFIMLKVMFF
jgi:hypothetical protein